jgi:hypothetical protein
MDDNRIQRLLKQAREDKRQFKGFTAQTRERDGKLVSSLEPNKRGAPGAKPGLYVPKPISTAVDWGLPERRKRTPVERSEAMASRMWKSAREDPAQMLMLAQKVQAHFWRKGTTVAFEDVRRMAQELIAQAEREEQERNSHLVTTPDTHKE